MCLALVLKTVMKLVLVDVTVDCCDLLAVDYVTVTDSDSDLFVS